MANLIDYVAWRGDIPLTVDPFNDIDALVLCQISYLDAGGLLGTDFKKCITLSEFAVSFRSAEDFQRRSDTGAMINKLSVQLLFDAGASERFGSMEVCGYRALLDIQKEEQFSAVTFLTGDKYAFTAFRGTDDTIVGWKEDFNMGVLETVPAQTDAVEYLIDAMKHIHSKFRIGGHSKGGNLAVYAGAAVDQKLKNRVIEIYNNDGPGFRDETIMSPEFQTVIPKLHSFYPQFSIVGMLFSHAGTYTVVESDQTGIMQHDPFSWHLSRSGFVALQGFDAGSKKFHETFNTWFKELSDEQRAKFVETLFDVLQATDARTNSELESNWLRSSAKIISALAKLDNESRENIMKTMQLLFRIARRNLPAIQNITFGFSPVTRKEKKENKW
ncbi:MAG: DUF2974 domain-containing protein [Treponema sp.]|nr:DUF2974 domain-containing protein [Treponema sp.]